MKALTEWQPYASLTAARAKTSETRSWRPPESLVGQRMAIHGAKRPVDWFADVQPIIDHGPEAREAINAALRYGRDAALRCGLDALGSNDWPLGCVVATARLVGCGQVIGHVTEGFVTYGGPTSPSTRSAILHGHGLPRDTVEMDGLGDYSLGRWVWLFADIEALDEPIPAVGRQGIWNWEPPAGVDPHLDAIRSRG